MVEGLPPVKVRLCLVVELGDGADEVAIWYLTEQRGAAGEKSGAQQARGSVGGSELVNK